MSIRTISLRTASLIRKQLPKQAITSAELFSTLNTLTAQGFEGRRKMLEIILNL